MPVFNLFFKIMKANRLRIGLLLLLFFAITVVTTKANSNRFTDTFKEEKAKLTIINKDEDSMASRHLIDYLAKRSELVEVGESEEELADAFFDEQIDYALTIPAGYQESIMSIDKEVLPLEKESHNSIMAEARVNSLIQAYQTNMTLFRPNLSENAGEQELQKLLDQIGETLDHKIEILEGPKNSETSNLILWGTIYQPMMIYILMMIFITCFGIVELAMRQGEVVKRERTSLLKERDRLWQNILATTVFTMSCWLVLMTISGFMYGGSVLFSRIGLLLMLNSLVATLGIQAMAYLIGLLAPNKGMLSFLGNFVSLFLAFSSGIFVPQSIIPQVIQIPASIATPIWFVKGAGSLLSSSQLSASVLKEYWICIGVQVLIGLAYWSLALVIKRIGQAKNIEFT